MTIKKTYLEVSADTKDQIERENQILDCYRDFRGALKESQVMAFQVLNKAETQVEVAKTLLEEATKALESNNSEDREIIARMELTRDERLRDLRAEDKRYQIAKDLAENLSVSYNTTEVVMAMLGALAYSAFKGTGNSSSQEMPVGLQQPENPQQDEELEQGAELVLKAMINAAKADGQIDAAEIQRILGKLKEAGTDLDARDFVIHEMNKPMDLSSIVAGHRVRHPQPNVSICSSWPTTFIFHPKLRPILKKQSACKV